MLEFAVVLQISAICLFWGAYITRNVPAPNEPIVGRTYDYLIQSDSGMFYGQSVVLDVKGDYVKVKRIPFSPAGEVEKVCTIREFQRYNTLIPVEANPFEKSDATKP